MLESAGAGPRPGHGTAAVPIQGLSQNTRESAGSFAATSLSNAKHTLPACQSVLWCGGIAWWQAAVSSASRLRQSKVEAIEGAFVVGGGTGYLVAATSSAAGDHRADIGSVEKLNTLSHGT